MTDASANRTYLDQIMARVAPDGWTFEGCTLTPSRPPFTVSLGFRRTADRKFVEALVLPDNGKGDAYLRTQRLRIAFAGTTAGPSERRILRRIAALCERHEDLIHGLLVRLAPTS